MIRCAGRLGYLGIAPAPSWSVNPDKLARFLPIGTPAHAAEVASEPPTTFTGPTDHTPGVANDIPIGGNISGDDRPRPDKRVWTDSQSAHYDDTGTQRGAAHDVRREQVRRRFA